MRVISIKVQTLAKPNYQFEKRQRDLAKKKKQEEKRQRRLTKPQSDTTDDSDTTPEESPKE